MTEQEFEKFYEIVLEKVKEKIALVEQEKKSLKDNEINDVDLEIAERLANRAFLKAKETKNNITVAVVNKGGNLILLKKMDEAIVASIDVSYKKAYTALSLNCPSSKVDLKQFPGLDTLMGDKLVLFGGGYPIVYNGKLIGGIGISGGSSVDDENIAIYAVKNVIESLL